MRVIAIVIAIFSLAPGSMVSADPLDSSLSAGQPKVKFVKEFATAGATKLLGASGDHFYFAKKGGSVDAIDKEGRTILTLQAKGRKGDPVLARPEAVAVAQGTIYVVDSGTHLVAMFALDGKYQGSFGAKGDEAGELRSPRGIAVHEGVVYVADTGNKRVQLFGNNGVYLTVLEINTSPENKAKKDMVPYELGEPTDIALNVLGQIYVLDADDYLVKVYAPNGVYLKHLPPSGKPLAISMAADGLYVADKDALTIQKYDVNDNLAYSFGSKGEGRALFKSITGLVAGKDQQVIVGDSKQSIAHVFLAEAGTPLEPLPKKASRTFVQWQEAIPATVGKIAWNGRDTLYGVDAGNKVIVQIRNGAVAGKITAADLSPVSVAVDKGGALWVLDKKKLRVVKLDDSGNILSSFGSRGSAVGQFDEPTDLAISNSGVIYVADQGNNWVQAFSNEGVFMHVIRNSVAAKLDSPIAIAVDPRDNLYVLDKGRSVVSAYTPTGQALVEFGKTSNKEEPSNLVKPVSLMATHDEVFVVDANQVKVFSHKGQYIRSFGAEGAESGEFDEPLAITAKDTTTFFVSERGNKRVQTFTTLYKPEALKDVAATDAVHAVELRWAPSLASHIKQYQIYRSRSKNGPLVRIATSSTNQFTDQGLEPGGQYYYRVAAETHYGYEGATSAAAHGTAKKYVPPVLSNVQVEAAPWQLKMSWQPADQQYLSAYRIYQKKGDQYVKIAETTSPEFVKDSLTPNTRYTFFISTLSTDGIESDKAVVNTATLVFDKQPLDIDVVKLHDIFSSTYKIYERDGVGRIKLTNNTNKTIEKIKVSFVLKGFMDFSTDKEIGRLLPGQSQEVNLMAVFNNSILDLTENSSAQALIEASYFTQEGPVVFNKKAAVNIYEKHSMIWTEQARYAAFVTPKDPPIINFVRAVVTQLKDTKDEVQWAAALFNALGTLRFTYIQDPTNPYQITSEKTDFVDYVNYPRETLERKSGDCDDLVALYSAALESLGITTKVILIPGHMLMMFSTGISADVDGYTMDNMYVIHEDKLWIPVETTLVGKSFVKAWESGATSYYKWKNTDLALLDLRKSWNIYKPATLTGFSPKPMEITPAEIEKIFPGESLSVLKISSQTKTRRYLQAIAKNPADMESHLQIGIVLAKVGDKKEAMKYFDKIIAAEPMNAAALNNRGNLFMLGAQYKESQKAYLAAAQASPADPEILINLAKSYKVDEDTEKAKAAFIKAQKLDPSMSVKYKALALELLNTL